MNLNGAKEKSIQSAAILDFKSVTGKGVLGISDGKRVMLGNQAFLEQSGIPYFSVAKASLLKQKSVKTAHDYLSILQKLKKKESTDNRVSMRS